MRHAFLVVPVLIALVGCHPDINVIGTDGGGGFAPGGSSGPAAMDPGMLAYSTTTYVETHGVHIPEGRNWSTAGMGGLTCQLDMAVGGTGTDLDVEAGVEEVVDGAGQVVLVATSGDAFQTVQFPSGNLGEGWSVPTGGVSRLVDGGHVDLAYVEGSCTVAFRGDVRGDVVVPDAYCNDGGAMVVADDATVWVGADETIARITAEGYEELPIGGVDLSIDKASGVVLAGAAGSTAVTAINADGTVAWNVDLGGAIAGFDGAAGHVVVAIAGPSDYDSELIVLDQASGAELSRQTALNVPAGKVSMSSQFVAIESAWQFDFFRL